jgi:hypothetical protein
MGRACPVCASSIELDRDLDLDRDRTGLGWDGITDGNQIPSALHGRHRLRLDPADQGRSHIGRARVPSGEVDAKWMDRVSANGVGAVSRRHH